MSDQVFWFATRGAGILAWCAASASIIVGLLMPSRLLGRRPTLPWLLDVHRFLGAMAVVFLGLHMITLWADEFVDFGIAELIVPGRAEVAGLNKISIALGVLAAWLLVAVEASSLIKDHLPTRAWHTIHLTSFGTMVAGLIHGIQVGSDTDNLVFVGLAGCALFAIALVGGLRWSRKLSDRKHQYEFGATVEQPAPARHRADTLAGSGSGAGLGLGLGDELSPQYSDTLVEPDDELTHDAYNYGIAARPADGYDSDSPLPVDGYQPSSGEPEDGEWDDGDWVDGDWDDDSEHDSADVDDRWAPRPIAPASERFARPPADLSPTSEPLDPAFEPPDGDGPVWDEADWDQRWSTVADPDVDPDSPSDDDWPPRPVERDRR